jgi:hypothetical protein
MMVAMKRLLVLSLALLWLIGCSMKGPPPSSICDTSLAPSKLLSLEADKQAVTHGEHVGFVICSRQPGFVTLWSTLPSGRIWPIQPSQMIRPGEPLVARGFEVKDSPGWKHVYVVWTRTQDAQPRKRPTCQATAAPGRDCVVAQVAIEVVE